MLVSLKEILDVARENHFAVGAFNATEVNLFRSVIEEAERLNSPVIIEAAPGEFNFVTFSFYKYVIDRAKSSSVPVALHLDHGKTVEEIMMAIKSGFTSVMIDGSLLSYDENVKITKEVVKYAHACGVSVEGEIGTIGAINRDSTDEGGVDNIEFTKPEEVVDFVSKTGVDALAIAIGTAHGIYPEGYEPKLELGILEKIKDASNVPLVLHGGSNNPDDEIAAACKIGVSKINISSDIKIVFFQKLAETINSTKYPTIPAQMFTPAINEAKKVVAQKMELFGSVGKANLF